MKVACIQINSGADMSLNIAKATKLIEEAASAGAEMILTPECTAFMSEDMKEFSDNLYTTLQHPTLIAFKETAKNLGVWLAVGSLDIATGNNGKAFNRSFLIDKSGNVISEYDKIHLFNIHLPNGEKISEADKYSAGSEIVVGKTPWGKLGMSICYDLRFPHLYRELAHRGADFIAVPAAFTQTTGKAHWEILLRARAIENGCFVFAPAQTGTHSDGRQTYGHSLIIDPWGNILADAGVDEGYIIVDIDVDLVQKTREILPSLYI